MEQANLFLAFAETNATRKGWAFRDPARDKAPSPLELKMREKQRLNRRYLQLRRIETKAVLASEPRLSGFLRYLKKVQAGQADELLEAIAESWLVTAPLPVRLFALRMVDARCNKINRMLGNEALDDPLPPEMNTYLMARALLYPGGRS